MLRKIAFSIGILFCVAFIIAGTWGILFPCSSFFQSYQEDKPSYRLEYHNDCAFLYRGNEPTPYMMWTDTPNRQGKSFDSATDAVHYILSEKP